MVVNDALCNRRRVCCLQYVARLLCKFILLLQVRFSQSNRKAGNMPRSPLRMAADSVPEMQVHNYASRTQTRARCFTPITCSHAPEILQSKQESECLTATVRCNQFSQLDYCERF